MNLSLGIVGLPNVGKSTLFNALTNSAIPAENYPFCTIDPNVGIVPVMDNRLTQLTELVKPAKTTPAVVEFWDIAGLVKGAAEGAGLGNKFLANIRNVAAIVHVVRAFPSDNIIHVENSIDPVRDIALINTELILKDLETVTAKINALKGPVRADPKIQAQLTMVEELKTYLDSGLLARNFEFDRANEELAALFDSLFLLTTKPTIYLVNTTESERENAVKLIQNVVEKDSLVIAMDIKLEAEIAALPAAEQMEYLTELGLSEPVLARLTREAYTLLGLISYFTAGEPEVRAWTIKSGTTAQGAAGVIHTDFAAKFIAAEIVEFIDFLQAGGWNNARTIGKVKLVGRDYIMQDGEVVLFKHNA